MSDSITLFYEVPGSLIVEQMSLYLLHTNMDSNIPFNAHFSFTAMFLKHILCLSSWLSRKTPRLYKALAALVIPREG